MATIEPRANGKYRAKIRMKGINKSKTFSSKRQAATWAMNEEEKISNGKSIVDTNMTVAEVLIKYADEVVGKDKEKLLIKKIAGHSIGDIMIKYLTTEDCQKWIEERKRRVKPNSVLREISALNPALTYALDIWKYIDENPLTKTKRPKADPSRIRRTSPEEEKAILDALFYDDSQPIKTQRDLIAVSFLIALETAMRQGEIWSTKPENIFFEKKYLHIPESKNGEARDVPLSRRAIELWKKVLDYSPNKPFPFPQYSCGTIFRHSVTMAGIKDYTFHDTRHEACTRLARKIEMLDLAKMIGHKDTRSLLIYYNPTAEEIADRLN